MPYYISLINAECRFLVELTAFQECDGYDFLLGDLRPKCAHKKNQIIKIIPILMLKLLYLKK